MTGLRSSEHEKNRSLATLRGRTINISENCVRQAYIPPNDTKLYVSVGRSERSPDHSHSGGLESDFPRGLRPKGHLLGRCIQILPGKEALPPGEVGQISLVALEG